MYLPELYDNFFLSGGKIIVQYYTVCRCCFGVTVQMVD